MPGNKKGLLLNIKDKIEISKEKCCPPHTFPHRLPFTEKIDDEPCHIHVAKWRMAHHILYCKIIKCPHLRFMLKENKKIKSKK